MNLTLDEVHSMNMVQLDILKEFLYVCEKLGLKYYMVHGSLLGTVRYNDFFPFDDDIDIAMPRDDYNILTEKASEVFRKPYFWQNCKTEENFPLTFGKLRNSETAFIQPDLKKLNVNMGMYIDVFPIDFYPDGSFINLWLKFKERVYSARISSLYQEKASLLKRTLQLISKVLCPHIDNAIKKRADLYSSVKKTNRVLLVGGKNKEIGIPTEWFAEGIEMDFSGLKVMCPKNYEMYLSRIYGAYKEYNPSEKYMNADGTVTVSAEAVSTSVGYYNLVGR